MIFQPRKVVTLTLFLVNNSQTADQLIQGPYRFQFEVFSRWLVEGHSFEEMWADLYRDGGQLALDGLGGGLHPARLLGLRLAAAALHTQTHTCKQCKTEKETLIYNMCVYIKERKGKPTAFRENFPDLKNQKSTVLSCYIVDYLSLLIPLIF